MRVDEVMLLSCLFLIGPSGDGRHNNSLVGGVEWRGGGSGGVNVCTRALGCVKAPVCACVCACA